MLVQSLDENDFEVPFDLEQAVIKNKTTKKEIFFISYLLKFEIKLEFNSKIYFILKKSTILFEQYY